MKDTLIRLRIIDLEKIVFEDFVTAISSFNKNGAFDVLAYHENFITLIEKKVVITKQDKSKQEITLEKGLLKNLKNEVEILIGVESIEFI